MKYIAMAGEIEIKAGDFLKRTINPMGFHDSYIDDVVYFAVYEKGDQLGIHTVKRFDENPEDPYFEIEPRFLPFCSNAML